MRHAILLLALLSSIGSSYAEDNEALEKLEIGDPVEIPKAETIRVKVPSGLKKLGPDWPNPKVKSEDTEAGSIVTIEYREKPWKIPAGIMWYGTRYRLTIDSHNKLVEKQKIPLKGVASVKNHKIKEVVFLYDPDGRERIGEER